MAVVFRGKMAGRRKRSTQDLNLWRVWGIPEPEREFMFHPTRKWRLDLAFPDMRLGIEIEGGIYRGKDVCPMCQRPKVGGHSSVSGTLRDLEKGNAVTLLGWALLRFTWQQFDSGEAYEIIKTWMRKNTERS